MDLYTRMYSYKGGSPAYSSCSSENLEPSSYDRRCMRCLIHELENGDDGDEVPTKGKFTRSFSEESDRSFAELFKKSEEDFGGEGTRVLFCKALEVTSDEDDEKKGLKRTFEDRLERKKGGRYKRHCSSDECGETLRPSSKCSVRSDVRRPQKRLQEQPPGGQKQKSRPLANRSNPSSSPQRVMDTKESRMKAIPFRELPNFGRVPGRAPSKAPSSVSSRVSSRVSTKASSNVSTKIPNRVVIKNKQRLQEKDEVTIYEKTIITVTSSDNYLIGDPMSPLYRYKSTSSQNLTNTMSNKIRTEGYVPASIGVYGAKNGALRKGLMKRDVSINRLNDVQILPVIQELNMQEDAMGRPMTRSSTSSDSECKDQARNLQKSITVRGNIGLGEYKSNVQGVHSTLFPNSCLKKETEKTNLNKKTVRFMVSDSQSNLGGERVPKKSLRLEKFPSGLSVKGPTGNGGMTNLTAAPVVVRIHSSTMEHMGSLGGDGTNNIIHRETAQRMIQQQVFNNMGFIQNINASRGQSMHLLKSPSKILAPGTPIQFSIEGFNESIVGPNFRAISLQRLGVENSSTEIHYTLSDLGIPRNKKDKEALNMSGKASSEIVTVGMRRMQRPKVSSLEQRRKNIRIKLNEPNFMNKITSSETKEISGTGTFIVNDRKMKTEGSNPMSPRSVRASSTKTPINNTKRSEVQMKNRAVRGNEVGEVDTSQKLVDLLPNVRRDKPQGTLSNKSSTRGVTRREVITSRRANELQSKKETATTELNRNRSMPNKVQCRPTTAGSKSIASRDHSPMSVRSAMNGSIRPKSQEVRQSSTRRLRSRGVIIEHAEGEGLTDANTSPDDSHSRRSSQSPNRPSSRKPHLNSAGKVNGSSASPSEKSHGAPRTHLTVRPKTQPDLKTTSTIRQHLRSNGIKSAAPANMSPEPKRNEMNTSKKSSGHPLRNKTLSEFLRERKKTGAGVDKKKNLSENRRISEPVKRNS